MNKHIYSYQNVELPLLSVLRSYRQQATEETLTAKITDKREEVLESYKSLLILG